ncbi:hypothetical protein Dda_6719 [Drechslerella dactyloides]|uniref:CHAT domain-containing protein n=1 Tax=Drechslerella dactyloides TaxID=74499 RepID=A0AAD6NGG1_DREDA|nr:hypothetical protein Dda_6719 [Drechslerella dactyloides]
MRGDTSSRDIKYSWGDVDSHRALSFSNISKLLHQNEVQSRYISMHVPALCWPSGPPAASVNLASLCNPIKMSPPQNATSSTPASDHPFYPFTHPLVHNEALTFACLPDDNARDVIVELFHRTEELEYLGKFNDAYALLKTDRNSYLLSSRSPSYAYLLGAIKLSQGYYREAREHFAKAQKILESADPEKLSEGSQQLLDFITVRLLLIDPESRENRELGVEKGQAAYQKWAKSKSPAELDYFSILIERAYSELVKDTPELAVKAPHLQSRHVEILKSQIVKGNAVVSFPIFLAKLNNIKSSWEVDGLKTILDKLLRTYEAPQPLINTMLGYCDTRMGQLSEGKKQERLFKEARRMYKAAGNIEAPCELDILETLMAGQKYIMAGTDDLTDLRRRIIHTIGNLGRLYSRFTELDYPNRMSTVLKQINKINDGMVGEQEITLISCRLWRQLGRATGIRINAATEFIAAVADVMKTDDIEDTLTVFHRFKEQDESGWDFDTRVNWLRATAAARYRIGRYDEAIGGMNEARELLEKEWRYDEAADIAEQMLFMKERRIHTLTGDEKAQALEELLDELDTAIEGDKGTFATRWKPMLRKKLWKAGLLLSDQNQTPAEKARSIPEASTLVDLVEEKAEEFVREDRNFVSICSDVQKLKAVLLRATGKPDEAVALLERAIPSKWKVFKNRTEDDDVREIEIRLLAVTMYIPDLTEHPKEMDRKTLEKRTKVCFHHLKEVNKLAEKNHLANSYFEALFFEAICHLALNDPAKALQNLVRASRLQDEIRRASPRGDKLESFMSTAYSATPSATEVTSAAIKACLMVPDAVNCWWWIQKTKARAFSEMMQQGYRWQDPFTRVSDEIANLQLPWESSTADFRDVAPLYRLVELTKTPVGYSLSSWDLDTMEEALDHRRVQIQNLMDEIEQNPNTRGALTMSMDIPATHEDMTWLANYRVDDREIVFIDWAITYDDIIISIYRPGGTGLLPGASAVFGTHRDAEIRIFKCNIGMQKVRDWAEEYLLHEEMPLESRTAYDDLDILNDLIAPIADVTDPEDLLVLSPTEGLHNIPLHALKIDTTDRGERITLIERNPVVYIPSFSIMRQCVTKLRLGEASTAETLQDLYQSTLVGVKVDYETPDAAVLTSLEYMSNSLPAAQVLTNEDCPSKTFTDAAAHTTDILHFHGHMDYSDPQPLQRHLVLGGDEKITARQLADLRFPKATAPLVSIITCPNGAQQIPSGDEPVGVVPALLAAGAASVITTLWPTDSACGLQFGELLYEDRKASASISRLPTPLGLPMAITTGIITTAKPEICYTKADISSPKLPEVVKEEMEDIIEEVADDKTLAETSERGETTIVDEPIPHLPTRELSTSTSSSTAGLLKREASVSTVVAVPKRGSSTSTTASIKTPKRESSTSAATVRNSIEEEEEEGESAAAATAIAAVPSPHAFPVTIEEPMPVRRIWDIARAVRKAVLDIKAIEHTSAPYYWAPFALYGAWLRGTGSNGALERGDSINGLSERFARDMELNVL